MRSSFYGLEISKTGLFYNQKALYVTSHNISNADVIGYTRQRLIGSSIEPSLGLAKLRTWERGAVGGGVSVLRLDQIRDQYLDAQYRKENASHAYWYTRSNDYYYIEDILNELNNNSISTTLAEFFNSINDLSQNPSDLEVRTVVQSQAQSLTDMFNQYYQKLSDQQAEQNDKIDGLVEQINLISQQIASYNEQIRIFELTGEQANDLRDKRNVLLDELSGLANIEVEYTTAPAGIAKVEICNVKINCGDNGMLDLITDNDYNVLAVRDDSGGELLIDGSPKSEIYFSTVNTDPTRTATLPTQGDEWVPTSGELKARYDMRDGNTKDNIGIPYLLEQFNILARTIAQKFNEIHKRGYTLDLTGNTSHNGVNFFDVPLDGGGVEDYSLINAGNFSISQAIEDDVNNIAASSVATGPNANPETGNNEIALELVALVGDKTVLNNGTFEDFLKSIVTTVGLKASEANKMYEERLTVMSTIQASRDSIMGVSLDEEMSNMIKYQHAYNAAARMITTFDEGLDTIINRMGVVGR